MMLKPGGPTDAFAKALTVRLWRGTVEEIGENRFDGALDVVLKESAWFPDISLIRVAAGVSTGICDPNEKAASLALTEIFKLMRIHGVRLKKDVDKIPAFDAHVEASLLALGDGDKASGLAFLAIHPNAPNSDVDPQWRIKTARDVESVWLQAWRQAQ